MSYTMTIKEEIASIESTKSELIAELAGFIRNNGNITKNKVVMTTENKLTAERVYQSIKDIFDYEIDIKTIENLNFSKKDLYQLTILDDGNILKALGIHDENNNYIKTIPNYIVGGNEEIRGYLRGVFQAVGSINDPKTSRYHMELLIKEAEEAVFTQKILNIFDLNAKILNREKGYMIYIKEAEKISDFIKILGANKAVMYYEDVRVYRDQKNKTNRLNNMEQANIEKIINTCNSQISDIELIFDKLGQDALDDKTLEAATYRIKYPESSLQELSEIMTIEIGKPITKSGLNHRMRKIKEIANRLKEE